MVTCPFESLINIMALSSRDWSTSKDTAWLWGIVCGWDKPCLDAFVKKGFWTNGEAIRLSQLHDKFREAWSKQKD